MRRRDSERIAPSAQQLEEEKKLLAVADAGFRTNAFKNMPRFELESQGDSKLDKELPMQEQVHWTEEEEEHEEEYYAESEAPHEPEIQRILEVTHAVSPNNKESVRSS